MINEKLSVAPKLHQKAEKPSKIRGFYLFDMQGVTGSIPVVSTTKMPEKPVKSRFFGCFLFFVPILRDLKSLKIPSNFFGCTQIALKNLIKK